MGPSHACTNTHLYYSIPPALLPPDRAGCHCGVYIGARPRIADYSIPAVAYSSCDPTASPRAGRVTSTSTSLKRL
jgi:hypothetical protein